MQMNSSKMSATVTDWAELGDVLDLIVHRLGIIDFIRFPAVCRSWRSCAVTHRSRCQSCPKSQTPWVLFTPYYHNYESDNKVIKSHLNLYDINHQKSYEIPVQPFFFHVFGCSNGFLVTVDVVYDLHIINPLTGFHYPLPPPSSAIGESSRCFIIENVFLKVGDNEWTFLKYGGFEHGDYMHDEYIIDAVFHKGKLYAVDGLGTYVFDLDCDLLEEERPIYLAGQFSTEDMAEYYMVESPDGNDLFLVVRKTICEDWRVTIGFIVHKFDDSRRLWNEVKDLGDLALFVGPKSLFFLDSPVVARNNICFFNKLDSGDVEVYDMGDGSIRQLSLLPVNLLEWDALWFAPSFFS